MLPSEVITHLNEGESVYDQPFAAKSLIGFLDFINDFTERPLETTHIMSNGA